MPAQPHQTKGLPMRVVRLLCIVLFMALLFACSSKEDKRQQFYDSAVKYQSEQKYEEAKIALRNALKIDPKFAPGYTLMGDLMVREKNLRQAFANFNRAVELDPKQLKAQIGLARIYVLAGQLDKAEAACKAILEIDPKSLDGLLVQATVMIRRGDIEQAKQALVQLIKDNPTDAESPIVLAEVLNSTGDENGAMKVLNDALTRASNQDVILSKIASMYMAKNRFEEAKQVYARLADAHPDKPGLRLLVANVMQRQGDNAGAIAVLKEIIAKEPANQQFRDTLAKLHLALKDVKNAEDVLSTGIKEIPKPYALVEELARLYIATGRSTQAQQLYEQWLKEDKDDTEKVELRQNYAALLLLTNQTDAALTEVNDMLKRSPSDPKCLQIRAQIMLRKQQPQAAIADLRQVVDKDPNDLRAKVQLADALIRNNEPLQGVEQLETVLKKEPKFNQARQLLIQYYVRANDLDKARAQLALLDQLNPGQTVGRRGIAELYAREKNYQKAIDTLSELQNAEPNDPAHIAAIGALRQAMGEDDKAMALYEDALKKDDQYIPAIESVVRMHMLRKEPAKATAFISSLIAKHADNPRLLYLRASLEQSQGQLDSAKKDYQAIIDKVPDWSPPYLSLVQLYIRSGDLDTGIAQFRKAKADKPEAPGFPFLLGLLLQQKGQQAEAMAEYREALTKNPQFTPAANNLAYLLASNPKDPQDLRDALDLAQKAAPSGLEAQDTLGFVQYKLKDTDTAIETFQAVLEKNDNPTTNYHIALAYLDKGDKESAKAHLQKAVQSPVAFEDAEAAKKLLDSLH